jgi:tetratricopeptide (TPR) repeat protein
MFWTSLKKAGNALLRHGHPLAVTIILGLGLSAFPGHAIAVPSALQLGNEALLEKQYAAAVEHFDRAVQQGMQLDAALGRRCIAYLMLQQPEQANQDCSAALAINPRFPKLWFYRGLALYRLGRYEAAIADFSNHLEQFPHDPRAHYNLGLALFALGDADPVIAHYEQALAVAPPLTSTEISNLYNDLGIAYLAMGAATQALHALDQAIAFNDRDPRAYFNRGCICHRQGDYAAALENFGQVLALDPKHAETYFNRGLAKHHLGDPEGARTDWQIALAYFQEQGNRFGVHRTKHQLQQLSTTPEGIG